MNVAGFICLILGLACLIVAITIVRERKYHNGGIAKGPMPRVGEHTCTLTLRADTFQAVADLERIRRLLDPKNVHGTIHWFDDVPYIGEFKCRYNENIGNMDYLRRTMAKHSHWRDKITKAEYIITEIEEYPHQNMGHPPEVATLVKLKPRDGYSGSLRITDKRLLEEFELTWPYPQK